MKNIGKTKKILSFVLAVVLLLGVAPFGKTEAGAASFNDINASEVFLKQPKGSVTCTLYAATMMMRRTAIAAGNSNWRSITPSNVASVAWYSGGLYYNFSYAGISVGHAYVNQNDIKGSYISLLKTYPQGVVAYNRGQPHAILLTDYDASTDTFYCADSDPYYASGRIPLSQSSITGSNQYDKLNRMTDYWYVKSPSVSIYNDTEKPVISNIRITNLDSAGYDISCDISDNVGVTKVVFANWTWENDRDDLLWQEGTIIGNTATFRVKKSEHNGESGIYATHIYAYDAAGNSGFGGINSIEVPIEGKFSETVYGNNKYVLYKGRVNADYAKQYCEKLGGHLARITSSQINETIRQMTSRFGYSCWIDGSDAAKVGDWYFSDGQKMTYFNWMKNEPSNNTVQNNLRIDQYGQWDDLSSNQVGSIYGFVCEFDNYIHDHNYTSKVTKSATCTDEGIKTFTCSCGDKYTEEIPALGHIDENNDNRCDRCGVNTGTSDTPDTPSGTCSHICHKGGFIWAVIRFFYKIFRTNKYCSCGAAHY